MFMHLSGATGIYLCLYNVRFTLQTPSLSISNITLSFTPPKLFCWITMPPLCCSVSSSTSPHHSFSSPLLCSDIPHYISRTTWLTHKRSMCAHTHTRTHTHSQHLARYLWCCQTQVGVGKGLTGGSGLLLRRQAEICGIIIAMKG